MRIVRNEWDTFEQASAALAEFPLCGDCKRALKLNQIKGRWIVLCSNRPSIHFGMSDWKESNG